MHTHTHILYCITAGDVGGLVAPAAAAACRGGDDDDATDWPAAARVTCVTNNQCGQPFRRARDVMRVCVRAVIPFRFFAERRSGGWTEKLAKTKQHVVNHTTATTTHRFPAAHIFIVIYCIPIIRSAITDGTLFFARRRGGHLLGTTTPVCKVHPIKHRRAPLRSLCPTLWSFRLCSYCRLLVLRNSEFGTDGGRRRIRYKKKN